MIFIFWALPDGQANQGYASLPCYALARKLTTLNILNARFKKIDLSFLFSDLHIKIKNDCFMKTLKSILLTATSLAIFSSTGCQDSDGNLYENYKNPCSFYYNASSSEGATWID